MGSGYVASHPQSTAALQRQAKDDSAEDKLEGKSYGRVRNKRLASSVCGAPGPAQLPHTGLWVLWSDLFDVFSHVVFSSLTFVVELRSRLPTRNPSKALVLLPFTILERKGRTKRHTS